MLATEMNQVDRGAESLYINVVVEKPLFQVVEDGLFVYLRNEDHVVIAALLDIIRLPVVWHLCALRVDLEYLLDQQRPSKLA